MQEDADVEQSYAMIPAWITAAYVLLDVYVYVRRAKKKLFRFALLLT